MTAAGNFGITERLARTKLFGSLEPALLATIAEAMREVRFPAGQQIFSRGDPGTELYLVIEGRVRLSILTADGRELSFNHAVPGDVFGEIAVLDASTRSADATALTDLHMMSLGAAALHRLMNRNPALALAAIRFLCARLREVSDHLEDVALFPIEVRLARYLLNRLSLEPGVAGKERRCIALGMSQNELALLLGASRPKVNAALTMLEESGAITRDQQGFVCDGGLLAEIARRE